MALQRKIGKHLFFSPLIQSSLVSYDNVTVCAHVKKRVDTSEPTQLDNLEEANGRLEVEGSRVRNVHSHMQRIMLNPKPLLTTVCEWLKKLGGPSLLLEQVLDPQTVQ